MYKVSRKAFISGIEKLNKKDENIIYQGFSNIIIRRCKYSNTEEQTCVPQKNQLSLIIFTCDMYTMPHYIHHTKDFFKKFWQVLRFGYNIAHFIKLYRTPVYL